MPAFPVPPPPSTALVLINTQSWYGCSLRHECESVHHSQSTIACRGRAGSSAGRFVRGGRFAGIGLCKFDGRWAVAVGFAAARRGTAAGAGVLARFGPAALSGSLPARRRVVETVEVAPAASRRVSRSGRRGPADAGIGVPQRRARRASLVRAAQPGGRQGGRVSPGTSGAASPDQPPLAPAWPRDASPGREQARRSPPVRLSGHVHTSHVATSPAGPPASGRGAEDLCGCQ